MRLSFFGGLAGGMGSPSSYLSSCELYDPVTFTVPGPPTGVSATAGNAQAKVSFTAPVSTGGSAITSYTVTSRPGGKTAKGAKSPITVKGLPNGTYKFTVAATNKIGTGTASIPST